MGWLLGFASLGLSSAALAEHAEEASAATQTNHPLDYNPVTNEHTAQMTLAKNAAMEAYNAGRLKEAEARFLEALQEAKLGFGVADAHVASCQNNLAEFYRNTGQFSKAEPLYQEALDSLVGMYGETHWLAVSALQNLALMYESRGRLEEAAETMRRVVALRGASLGDGHFLFADALFALAHILAKQGEHGQAASLIARAIGIMEESGSIEGTPVVLWCCELATSLQAQGRHDEAIAQLQKALEYTKQLKGEMPAKGSRVAERLVAALEAGGQAGRALEVQAALVQARTLLHGHDLRVADAMLRLAAMQLATGAGAELAAGEQMAESAVALLVQLEQDAQRFRFANLLGASPEREVEVLQLGTRLAQARMLLSRVQAARGRVEVAQDGLRVALASLQRALTRGQEQLQHAASTQRHQAAASQLAGHLVEAQLLLLDALEALAQALRGPGSDDAQRAEAQRLLQQAEALAAQLAAG